MMSDSYKQSGVNIDEGNRFVGMIKKMVESTYSADVIGGLGGFAGLYNISAFKSMDEPVLVAATDGVGTKLKVAIEAGVYDTVGVDLVAMSVNDLIVTGARPLFFLDYIATAHLSAEAMSEVVKGITDGCVQAGAALLGGETAEMPGMYAPGDFDLAGFAVGIVDRKKAIDGSGIEKGDVIVGLPSSGFHSNGYSLLRKVFFDDLKMGVDDLIPGYGKVGELLLKPTKIYVKSVLAAVDAGIDIKGMVHITGGGFYENINRVLPEGSRAVIDKSVFVEPDAVKAFRAMHTADEKELYRVFNMGIGFVFVVSPSEADRLMNILGGAGESPVVIGEITDGNKDVLIKGIDL